MQISQIPAKMPLVWAQNAGSGYIRAIPSGSQIGITNGAASLNDGPHSSLDGMTPDRAYFTPLPIRLAA